jgi:hypothetical protein
VQPPANPGEDVLVMLHATAIREQFLAHPLCPIADDFVRPLPVRVGKSADSVT